jgi:hypothetical protein
MRINCMGIGALAGAIAFLPAPAPAQEPAARISLGALPVWDDGYAEMCYYNAVVPIYGKPRSYTRVHVVVREWLDVESGVKTDNVNAPGAIPVLKLNIAEEIPTENYQYRYMRTLLADRYTLGPRKITASSQEWCGMSFRHLRWNDNVCDYKSFSYFEGEADRTWEVPAKSVPFETLLLAAREIALGEQREFTSVLPALRSNHQVAPDAKPTRLRAAFAATDVTVTAGQFEVREVSGRIGDRKLRFWIETAAPHRLIKYNFGDESGELRFSEHRAYWDRGWPSGDHEPEQAP